MRDEGYCRPLKAAWARQVEKLSEAARQRLEEKKKKEKRDGQVEENPLRLKAHKGRVSMYHLDPAKSRCISQKLVRAHSEKHR
jgi:hypothetical protein